jgi:hypothetical protein
MNVWVRVASGVRCGSDCTERNYGTVEVDSAGLPYKMVPNYGGYKPGTVEPQGDIAEFGPEADAWLAELEKLGFDLRQ